MFVLFNIYSQEVNNFVRKARGRSAPGTNGIPYRVYKNCEKLMRRLWGLLGVGYMGKVFFGILVKRLTQFLSNNKYIDTSVQKERKGERTKAQDKGPHFIGFSGLGRM